MPRFLAGALFLSLLLLAGCGGAPKKKPEPLPDLAAIHADIDALDKTIAAIRQPVDETEEQRLQRLGLKPEHVRGMERPAQDFAGLVERVAAAGEAAPIGSYLAGFCGLPASAIARSLRLETDQRPRLNSRSINVAKEAVVLTTYAHEIGVGYTSWVFTADTAGTLLRVSREEGRVDAEGSLVPGSKRLTTPAATDELAVLVFRGEVDYWLDAVARPK